jgi:hypothetical protein
MSMEMTPEASQELRLIWFWRPHPHKSGRPNDLPVPAQFGTVERNLENFQSSPVYNLLADLTRSFGIKDGRLDESPFQWPADVSQ